MQECLEDLFTLVKIHIDIDNEMFSPMFYEHLPIPDFQEQYYKSRYVLNEIERLFEKVNEQRADRNVLKCFRDYLIFFLASSSKLAEMAYELHFRTLDESELSNDEAARLFNEYKSNERHRLAEGEKLNKMIYSLYQQ